MGGMCVGSLCASRFVSTERRPLRVLACLEIGIGVCGLLILAAMPVVNDVYAALASPAASGTVGLVLRALVATVCLLPPTIMMGATLPVIARRMQTTPSGVARMGFCYAANVLGAVAGSLAAGFYLLRFHDVAVATWTAVAINAGVAFGALALASSSAAERPVDRLHVRAAAWPVYVTTALSGLTALSAEVIWTRYLALLLGATVYTFALVLALFLLGLALGSGAGSVAARRLDPRVALGVCQLMLAVTILWAAYSATQFLPYWPIDVALPTSTWVSMQLDFARVAWVVLPGALLWGASFPLALAAAARGEADPARLVGGLYAANTIGAIVGVLATSFILIAWIGTQHTQQWLIGVSIAAALLMLAPVAVERLPSRAAGLAVAGSAAVLATAAVLAVPALPGAFVAYGRFMPTRAAGADVVHMAEGLSASVAVSRQADGTLTYHNAGKAQASTYPQDMRLQRMLGHLTTLVPEHGQSYLVIGLGAGITAGAVSADPGAARVVVAEIEPLAREAAATYFREQNFGVTDNPKVEIRIDDGRHFLLTTDETFDGITSDPLDPWVRGAAALYTREFWELVRARLNPGGVVTVFVQLYETTEDAVRSELATFFEVFPNGAVFANTVLGAGYDAVLLARADEALIDVDRIDSILRRPEYAHVARSLREVGFGSATDLLGTYTGRAADLAPWLDGSVVNTDRNLRLQYLAGEGLNLNEAAAIFDHMSSLGEVSLADYFDASPERMRELRRIVRARGGRL